ncbi:hypothetical protein ACLB2K_075488 [Fragaria x ananassa]
MGWETWEKAAQAVFGMGGLFTLPRTRGTNTQPLLEPARLREAIEPAQREGIEPAHGEENQEIEPAHDAAGGEQYQPVVPSMPICTYSTIGEMLAKETNCSFIDADDYHPQSNKAVTFLKRLLLQTEKMRKGIPLSEENRIPWLETLRNALRENLVSGSTLILGCSALQRRYRDMLRSADPNYEPGSDANLVKFILLDAKAHMLAARLEKRVAEGKHFMPPELLQSQLDLLQIDDSEGILKVVANFTPQNIVNTIQRLFFVSKVVQECNH